jgi:hypothetical protein
MADVPATKNVVTKRRGFLKAFAGLAGGWQSGARVRPLRIAKVGDWCRSRGQFDDLLSRLR